MRLTVVLLIKKLMLADIVEKLTHHMQALKAAGHSRGATMMKPETMVTKRTANKKGDMLVQPVSLILK